MRPPTTGRKVAAISIIAILGIVVVVLSAMALLRSQPAASDSNAEPLPALSPTPSATPTPTPTANPTPATAAVNRADERFLSYVGESAWRASAGSCDGAAPVLQRMNDGGEWADVATQAHELRQIASLDAHEDGAELVGGVAEACTPASLRSFSAGAQWESYEDTLARSRYLDLADPGVVHTRIGEIAAPCVDATGLRAWGELVALVCDGQAWRQTNETWTALELTNVKTLAIDDAELIIGHQSDDCAGLALSRVSGTATAVIGCAENVDVAQPIAVAATDDGVAVWAADNIVRITG